MRIVRMTLALLCLGWISGCSIINGVDQSLNYVSETTAYIEQTTSFFNGLPNQVVQAVQDTAAKTDMMNQLESMQQQIEEMNLLEPPAIATEIHDSIVRYNEQLLDQIGQLKEQLPLQNFNAADYFQQYPLANPINQLNELIAPLEAL